MIIRTIKVENHRSVSNSLRPTTKCIIDINNNLYYVYEPYFSKITAIQMNKVRDVREQLSEELDSGGGANQMRIVVSLIRPIRINISAKLCNYTNMTAKIYEE